MHNTNAIVLLVSLVLVALAGGGSFTNAAAENMTPAEYWQAVLPETPMPLAIYELSIQSAGLSSSEDWSVTERRDVHAVKDLNMFAKEMRKIGPNSDEERARSDVKYPFWYGRGNTKSLKKYTYWYKSQSTKDSKKYPFWYGSGSTEVLKKYPFWYEAESTKHLKKNPFFHGSGNTEDLKKYPFWYRHSHTEDIKKYPFWYRHSHTKDIKKYPFWFGSENNEDVKTLSVEHGSIRSEDITKYPFWYGSENNKDLKKYLFWYGSRNHHGRKEIQVENTKDLRKDPFWYGFESSEDLIKEFHLDREHDQDNMRNQDEENLLKISGSVHGDKGKMAIIDSAPNKGDRQGRHHIGTHKDGEETPAGSIFFFHRDVLRPGSVITLAVPATTTLPPLLPRRLANSIPFCTEHFADILAMFAPESDAIAGEIRWTLAACEHPGVLLPGYKAAGCATSIESLAELPMALLRTRNVRAFSPDMAVDPAGTPALRGRYNVTAVKRLTDSPEIVTCHDVTYPYAVFFCHTANPTAAYSVTLAREDGKAPVMEALAVCHLDRSQVHGSEPGKEPACHFLTKLSVIWVPVGEQGGTSEVQ